MTECVLLSQAIWHVNVDFFCKEKHGSDQSLYLNVFYKTIATQKCSGVSSLWLGLILVSILSKMCLEDVEISGF